MAKKLRLLRNLLFLVLALLILHLSFLKLDYQSVKNGNKPIFSIRTAIANDGGSVLYKGLGYEITSYHFLWSEEINGKKIDGFMVGTEVKGITLIDIVDQLIAKEDLRFTPREKS